jgi:hypothetical protein
MFIPVKENRNAEATTRKVIQSLSNIARPYKHVSPCYPFLKWAGGKTQVVSIGEARFSK